MYEAFYTALIECML